MDSIPSLHVGIRHMSLYDRLIKEKDRLGGKALRFPQTDKELLDRKRWERVYTILTRRYAYEKESFENELRGSPEHNS